MLTRQDLAGSRDLLLPDVQKLGKSCRVFAVLSLPPWKRLDVKALSGNTITITITAGDTPANDPS